MDKRIVGIDFGIARIGLAISDAQKIIATPFKIVQAERKTEQTIQKILQVLEEAQTKFHCEVEEIVVGLPLMMNGKKGFLADEVEHFVSLLKQAIAIPVVTWDERLTTVQAERSLRESKMTRRNRAKIVDTVSAVIILQGYLDLRGQRNKF
jgi:putative Holliday junction resolvase